MPDTIQYPDEPTRALRAKFRGHRTLNGKTKPRYPETAEREYRRVMNGYMKLINEELRKQLPGLMNEYKVERRGDSRMDDRQDLERKVREAFTNISISLEKKLSDYRVDNRLSAIARLTKGTSLREWKRAVHGTLGIDLSDDYYNAQFYERFLKKWVDDNVLKIKSIPTLELQEMQDIILDGYRQGRTIRDIQHDIQEAYNVDKHKAQMLARDQVASLNAEITRQQQTDAGVKRYKWSTSHDARVRECHAELDGQIFEWDNPPEMWYDTKSRGRVMTGRFANPGEDYCCRCCAIPVFDFDTLDMPAKG